MYLLDTVTVSQTLSRRANAGALAWIGRQRPAELFLSVVTVAEIRCGAVHIRARDPKFADRLDVWLTATTSTFGDRIVPIGVSVARIWGTLQATVGHGGEDIMIAATALDRSLVVVTRNTRQYAGLGVKVENPFT